MDTDERMIPLRELRAKLDGLLHEAAMCGHFERYYFERRTVEHIVNIVTCIIARYTAFCERYDPRPAEPESDDPADYCAVEGA